MPRLLTLVMETVVSTNRIEKYLKEDNVEKNFILANHNPQSDVAVKIENGSFYWVTAKEKKIAAEKNKPENQKLSAEGLDQKLKTLGLLDPQPTNDDALCVLKDINMKIKKGSFVVILGE
jgi:hypothetical protein